MVEDNSMIPARCGLVTAIAVFCCVAFEHAHAQSIEAIGSVTPIPTPGLSDWVVPGGLCVGCFGPGSLNISGGGTVTHNLYYYNYNYIGYDGVGTATVTGSGSLWSNTGDLILGSGSGSGTLSIEDGGTVRNYGGYIGYSGNYSTEASGVTVTGPGSTWENSSLLVVGYDVEGYLAVENGGSVKNSTGYIGAFDTGSARISGSGSTWTNTGTLYVGYGSGGKGFLTVENGGTVTSVNAFVGYGEYYSAGTTGSAKITGSNSTWINSGTLYVGYGYYGYYGHANTGTLTIENGGTVKSSVGYIGYGDYYYYDANYSTTGEVKVTGAGSTWSNSSNLYVGIGNYNTGGPSISGTLTIENGGIVTVGALQGNGRHNGTVTLATGTTTAGTINIGAAANGAATAAGTLDAADLVFGSGDGTLIFNHTSDDYSFFTALSGYGTVRHLAGVTKFSADSSAFTGTTTINGGSLLLAGNARLGGDIIVGDRGLFGGTGSAGSAGRAVTVENGGILSPGLSANSIGALGIGGNLLLKDGSVYAVNLAGSDSALTSVSGTATIESGASVRVTALDANINYNTPQSRTLISSAGGITGNFSATSKPSYFLNTSFVVGNSGKDLMLQVSVDNSFSSIANTPNARSLAAALDALGQSGASLALYNSLLLMSADEIGETYRQLSGEIHASLPSSLMTTTLALNAIMNQRIQNQSGNPLIQEPIAPLGYVEEDRPAPENSPFSSFEAKGSHGGFDPDRLAFWTSGFGSWGRVEGANGGARTSSRSGGFAVGADSLVDDVWRLGVFGGYSGSSSGTVDADASSDNYHLGAYAGREWSALSLRSGINYTWSDIDTVRSVTALNQTLSANHDAGALNLFGELAYRMSAGDLAFEPFANLAHVRVKTDGFTETGGSAALTVAGDTMDATFTTLGLRAGSSFDFAGTAARLHGTLGWQHAFGDTVANSTARFGTGEAFAIFGKPLDKDVLVLETGLDIGLSPSAALGIGYSGRVGANAREHGANARLRVAF